MCDNKVLNRDEVKEEYIWDLGKMYKSDDDWQQDYDKVKNMGEKLAKKYVGGVTASAENLYGALSESSQIERIYENVAVYANMRLHEDMANAKYLAMTDKADNLGVEIGQELAYIVPEIAKEDEKVIRSYIKENEKLKLYERTLELIIKRKAHMLSEKEEALLAKTGDISGISSNVYSMFNNADASFGEINDENGQKVQLTHGRYSRFMESRNRNVRKEAFKTLYGEYISHKNTLAALYMGNVKQNKFYADVRNYESSRQMCLSDSEIPETVYDNLIDTVHEFLPAFYKYVSVRKRALGVDELHMYDVYAPVTESFDMKIPYEKAKEMVLEGLAPMGEEYLSLLKEGFENRWIDIYENKGKRSGAYSWGTYDSQPYVLLNYQDKLNDVFTLAHEMGHSLHSYYTHKTQPYVYGNYEIFVAEVASTCNESLLINHLIEKCVDKQEKIYLLNYFIDQFKGTIFRQTMFAEFEKKTHEMVGRGENLNAENLCEIYLELNKLYFGPEMVSDEEISMEWSRIPHFYSAFYVYQYATGFSAAIALSKRIRELGEKGVADYMKFLTGGSSKEPLELLKLAGVDMTTAEPIREALKLFESLVDELDKLVED